MGRRTTHLLAAMLLTGLAMASGQTWGQSQPAASGDIVVNMRGVEIADVAEQVSRVTGRTIILDPSVKGAVNVASAEPLSPAGVWDLFQSVLRAHGFAAVRSGSAWRVIPQASAVRDPGTRGRRIAPSDVVTRMIRLRNVPSEAAARVFRPLVASFGTIEALPSPNAIVVTDFAENVQRVEQLALALDSGGGAAYASIKLEHASAKDVAAAIQGVVGEPGGPGGTRVIADERSNVVLVRGEPAMIEEARRLARTLDQPGGATPVTRLFRLSNADAESVTDVLRGVMGAPEAATNPVARSLGGGRLNPLSRTNAGEIAPGVQLGAESALGRLGGASLGGVTGNEIVIDTTRSGAGGLDSGSTAQGFSTPELTVQPAPELNAIVVRGTPAAIAAIEPLIGDLDVRRPQVVIEAAIAEITGDDAEALGIQLGLGAAAVQAGGGATSFTTLGLPLRSILSALGTPAAGAVLADGLSVNADIDDDFSVLVQALGQSTKANLLSTPSLTTLDNTPAEIVVGQNVPFRTGSFATDGNTLTPFTTIEREDVGITLRVVPRIHRGDVVRLEVSQEVSSLANATVAGAADLITNRRSIQTTVLADDGQTIVLGGLITDDQQRLRSQVPILGDVPVLGELFKSRRNTRTKRTLFIFLKPTILRDRTAAQAATQAKYDRLRRDEQSLGERENLILDPPAPRLPVEIDGVY